MVRYELSEGVSDKFWQVSVAECTMTTVYGRIGAKGQTTVNTFDSPEKAKIEHCKRIAEKLAKGYKPADVGSVLSATTPRPPAASAHGHAPMASASNDDDATPSALATRPIALAPSLRWTPALAAAAARQRQALEVGTKTMGEAATLYASLHQSFTQGRKSQLDAYLQNTAAPEPLAREVVRNYGSAEMPRELNARSEAAAFLIIPPIMPSYPFAKFQEAMISYWVAHSGLLFALEAMVATFKPLGIESLRIDPWSYPNDPDECRIEFLLTSRFEQLLRAYLVGLYSGGQAVAHDKALELRTGTSLLGRSFLNAVFLDPDWIDADLRECISTKDDAMFTALALLHAKDTALLNDYLAGISAAGAIRLGCIAGYDTARPDFSLALLDALGERGIQPLTSWVTRLTELWDVNEHRLHRLVYQIELTLEALGAVAGSPSVAAAAAAVLTKCSRQKLGKSEGSRRAATVCLRNAREAALPAVRAAAKRKERWARDLMPQLERLTAPPPIPLEEAAMGELPAPLASKVRFKAPTLWLPQAFTPPQTWSGKALPPPAMEALGRILAKGNMEALSQVRESCTPESLAAFAWDLFQAWLVAGSLPKDKWAFLALSHLGDDACARRLTPLIRAWPGEAAHGRAVLGVDVLANIGTDVALMMLNGIAQKVKFKGLQGRAQIKMHEVAEARGLTADELADRLVPDLDLEDDGSKTLDFGPRSFRVGFDESLSPFVMDATGARLKNLPKPNSQDDADLAAAAVESWKAMKKDARVLSSLQILRLELAMGQQRRWLPEDFQSYLVRHPLSIHLVRRLVWGTFNESEEPMDTFRVAEDGSYASRTDEAFEIPPGARVGVAHRLFLGDAEVAEWAAVFSDYELAQPFEQLARQTFELEPHEKANAILRRFEGRIVESKKIIGLQSRGWHRGTPQDGGIILWFYKPVTPHLNAGLRFEQGISIDYKDFAGPNQTLGTVEIRPGEPEWRPHPNATPPAEVPAAIMSDVLRDIESLGSAVDGGV